MEFEGHSSGMLGGESGAQEKGLVEFGTPGLQVMVDCLGVDKPRGTT